MTIELAAIDNASKPLRFGGTPLQQFARAGLALTIVDFRKMCGELSDQGLGDDAHEIADMLFNWLTRTSDT